MRSLYLRIWLTVVAALALFAAVSGWLVQRHLEQERERIEASVRERVSAWGELMQRSLPPADAPRDEQAAAVHAWLEVPVLLAALLQGPLTVASASTWTGTRDVRSPSPTSRSR